jgi:hypothetical protein
MSQWDPPVQLIYANKNISIKHILINVQCIKMYVNKIRKWVSEKFLSELNWSTSEIVSVKFIVTLRNM